MRIPKTWKLITLAASNLLAHEAYSRSLIQQYGRMEIDWGRQKIRFWSESSKGPENLEANLEELEQKTLNSGINDFQSVVTQFHGEYLKKEQVEETIANHSATLAGELVAKTTYVYLTEYGTSGDVKLYFENQLIRAISRGDLLLKGGPEAAESEAKFSGLVLRADQTVAPRASYRVVDETGKILFSIRDVYKTSYQKNLMGRWVVDPDREELVKIVGPQPLSIQFTENAAGDFVVPGNAWSQFVSENKVLLSQAKIALVVQDSPGSL